MLDSRHGDRTPVHVTMMAPQRQPSTKGTPLHHPHHHHQSTHGHSRNHSLRSAKSPKPTTTPAHSPRLPYSVGQNHPPSSSPCHSQDARPSSPNYFGLVVNAAEESRHSSGLARDNWSPSSSIKSFGAAIPRPIPLDANPEFEAFRRQADLNRGKSFAFAPATSFDGPPPSSLAPVRPRPPPRWNTHSSDVGTDSANGRSLSAMKESRPASRMDIDQDSLHDSAYVSADSKRNSESSLLQSAAIPATKFELPPAVRTNLTRTEDRDPRLSVMEHRVDPPSPKLHSMSRASTLPSNLEPGQPSMIPASQLKDMLNSAAGNSLLVLDIRSSQNYAQSRITGALNLCIPTTLLKRATFNIQKLQQTFQSGPDSERFSIWREADSIVVYDAHSSDTRDAVTAQNMIKKFTNEGYCGNTYILRGGFSKFQESYPKLVDHRSTAQMGRSNDKPNHGGLAPVIGGVMLPGSKNDVNPFFSNIRQNMDLADGVGQLDISRPGGLESPTLPRWLRDASAVPDHGKKVSDKFYRLEREEQSRMKSAYAVFNPQFPRTGKEVELSGVEKGGKNRYKDILPFEHARVKLGNRPTGSCDYINASHIQASRSNKRYIATQGPLPATFEDFWSVIWEQDIRVIVMLTAESEGGQLKCHPYWKNKDHGPIKLQPLSEKKASLDIDKHRADSHAAPSSSAMSENGRRRANTTTSIETSTQAQQPSREQGDSPYVIIRKFALSHAAHPFAPIREITHLHFASWPDFGTPAQPSHLLALVELANVMQRAALPVNSASIMGNGAEKLPMTWYDEPESNAESRPMLVHCSAGCGRTGTFCTVDSVIDMLKRHRQANLDSSSSAPAPAPADADVDMGGVDDAVSPMGTTTSTFESFSRTRAPVVPRKRRSSGSEAIDTEWVQDDTVDLIHETVEDFRKQRLSMVQSLRQFVLCYETVLEWVTRMSNQGGNAPGGRGRSESLRRKSETTLPDANHL